MDRLDIKPSRNGAEFDHCIMKTDQTVLSKILTSDVFSGNKKDIPIMTAPSCTDLNFNHSRNEETQNNKITEDGDFPALECLYERQTHIHHVLSYVKKRTFHVRIFIFIRLDVFLLHADVPHIYCHMF